MLQIRELMILKSLSILVGVGLLLGPGICLCAEDLSTLPTGIQELSQDHDAIPDHSHSHHHDGETGSDPSSHESKDECGCSSTPTDLYVDGAFRVVEVDRGPSEAAALESLPSESTARSQTFHRRPRDDSGPPRPHRLPLFLRIRKLSL